MSEDKNVEDYPTYEQAGGNKAWDEMTELEKAYYDIRKLKNALAVNKNTIQRLRAAASPVSDAVELVKVYDEYIQFLSNNPAESIAHVHGFRHSDADIKKGKALREKISLLKTLPTPTNVQEQDNTAYNKATKIHY